MLSRTTVFIIGLFSLTIGLLSYNSEVATASIPVVTGGLVMLLAIFNLLPKLKQCRSCHKKIPKKVDTCRFCGAQQPPHDS